jgi:hypothetical protein
LVTCCKRTGKVNALSDDGQVEQYGCAGDHLEAVKPIGTQSLKGPHGKCSCNEICVGENRLQGGDEVFIVGTWGGACVAGLFREYRHGPKSWKREPVEFDADTIRTPFPGLAVRGDNVFIEWEGLPNRNRKKITVFKLNC